MSRRLWRNDRFHKSGGILVKERTSSFEIIAPPGHSIWLVDASGGDVTVTLPAAGLMQGKTLEIVASVSPGANSITVNDSGASEVWTGYAKGDHVVITASNGTIHILDEQVTVRGTQAFTNDLSIAASGTYYKKTTGYAVDVDVGDWFDSSTNHRIDAAFDCTLLLFVDGLGNDNDTRRQVRINNTAIQDLSAGGSPDGEMDSTVWSLTLSASDYVEVYFGGNSTVSSTVVAGDAAKDETKIYWEVLRRLR
jgi:hypothetical protein